MNDRAGQAATRLDEIIEEFADLDVRERLELLLEFAEELPPLPERLQEQKEAGLNRVHECQTPVYLWVEANNGRVQLYADSAPEAPTVKGFIAILVNAFSGASPQDILAVKPDVVQRLGLVEALGMVRMRGLHAILHRIRKEVEAQSANGNGSGGTP